MAKGSVNRELEQIHDKLADLECRSKLWYMGTDTPIEDVVRLILEHLELEVQGPTLKKKDDWRPAICCKKKGKK